MATNRSRQFGKDDDESDVFNSDFVRVRSTRFSPVSTPKMENGFSTTNFLDITNTSTIIY